MGEGDRTLVLGGVLAALLVSLVGGFLRAPAPREPGPSLTWQAEGGLAARVRPRAVAPGTGPAAAGPVLPELPADLSSFPRIALLPLAGALPTVTAEEGPPWHLVLQRDAQWTVTRRLREGRAAVPDGLEPGPAARCLHVVIPFAAHDPKGVRRRAALELLRHLVREHGYERGAILPASELVLTPTLRIAEWALPELIDEVFAPR